MHNSPYLYVEGNDLYNITGLFQKILNENDVTNNLKKQAIISLTDLVYIEGTRHYTEQNEIPLENRNSYYAKFRTFEELIGKYYITEKSPSAYAGMLNMTSKHLNRITQAVVGKTASDIIIDRVMLEAKKALILQKDSFSEIGFSLGYDDYAYFSRLFKKRTGETPSGFLNRYKRQV
jgi:AraC-like DNA-binding protein